MIPAPSVCGMTNFIPSSGRRLRCFTSTGLTPDAWMRILTSPGIGSGFGSSISFKTSRAGPLRSHAAACILSAMVNPSHGCRSPRFSAALGPAFGRQFPEDVDDLPVVADLGEVHVVDPTRHAGAYGRGAAKDVQDLNFRAVIGFASTAAGAHTFDKLWCRQPRNFR